MTTFKLSVNDLIEFSARRGDYRNTQEAPTALQGQSCHKLVQSKRGDQWLSEYWLASTFTVDEFDVELRGRADLVKQSDQHVIVEEIKSSYSKLTTTAPEKLEFYWSQAIVYGAMLCNNAAADQVREIELRLTLVTLPERSVETQSRHQSAEQLRDVTLGYLKLYCDWLRKILLHQKIRNQSCLALQYPYPQFREGQRELAQYIYRSFQRRRPLLIEAPTGLGKTMASLFPAFKFLANHQCQQILYLTCKTAGQIQPNIAIRKLQSAGVSAKSLTVIAKDKICLCQGQASCPYQENYFDKLPKARDAALECSHLDLAQLQEIAQCHQICPFSLSLEMAKWVDIVIADVNYFYDPLVRLNTFYDQLKTTLLIVDEAHNLPIRAREMFSAQLIVSDLVKLLVQHKQIMSSYSAASTRNSDKLINEFQRLSSDRTALDQWVEKVKSLLEDVFSHSQDQQMPLFAADDNGTEQIKKAIRFVTIFQLMRDEHCLLTEGEDSDFQVRLHCTSATYFTEQSHREVKRMVGFSGTLRPIEYYRDLLGLSKTSDQLVLASPFPPHHLSVLRCTFINTRLGQRRASLEQLIDLINLVVSSKPGNYLVFAPSYQYLKLLEDGIRESDKFTAELIVQQPSSGDAQQKAFINQFKATGNPIVGLAVLGGVYGEGVDFTGESLIGSIIVGLGLPPPSIEQRHLERSLSRQGFNPYLYGQLYPSFCRVLQAAGRVIRSETDRGVVVLVDDRFCQAQYEKLMPAHWLVSDCADLKDAERQLTHFWLTECPDGRTT